MSFAQMKSIVLLYIRMRGSLYLLYYRNDGLFKLHLLQKTIEFQQLNSFGKNYHCCLQFIFNDENIKVKSKGRICFQSEVMINKYLVPLSFGNNGFACLLKHDILRLSKILYISFEILSSFLCEIFCSNVKSFPEKLVYVKPFVTHILLNCSYRCSLNPMKEVTIRMYAYNGKKGL